MENASTEQPENRRKCEKMLFSALNNSERKYFSKIDLSYVDLTIRKLIAEIEDAGCAIPSNFFQCRPSTDQVGPNLIVI